MWNRLSKHTRERLVYESDRCYVDSIAELYSCPTRSVPNSSRLEPPRKLSYYLTSTTQTRTYILPLKADVIWLRVLNWCHATGKSVSNPSITRRRHVSGVGQCENHSRKGNHEPVPKEYSCTNPLLGIYRPWLRAQVQTWTALQTSPTTKQGLYIVESEFWQVTRHLSKTTALDGRKQTPLMILLVLRRTHGILPALVLLLSFSCFYNVIVIAILTHPTYSTS